MSTWEERMAAKAHARRVIAEEKEFGWLRSLNAYYYPRRLAVANALDGCHERPCCYEAKPDGTSGRWLAFHIGPLSDCDHTHHENEIWLA